MARTPEQVAADDALTIAVQTAALVYGWAPDAVVTDYLVVLSAQTWDADGDITSDEGVLLRDGYMPDYRARGLAQYAVDALTDRDLLDEYASSDTDTEEDD
jgi:hypothetical protein